MGQETWGLKLDAELKEKVQDIIKNDFDNSKEFMEQVVNLYELNKLKKGENVLTEEIDELESLTRRINGVFINANAKINTMLKDKDIKSDQQQELKQKLIERLQVDIARLEQEKEEISNINDTLVNSNQEYIQEVNQLTKSTNTLEQLVSEYKEKNDTLTGLLAEYKEDREQNKNLQEENRDLKNKLHELNVAATEQAKRIVEADEKIKAQSQEYDKKIQEQSEAYTNKIQELKFKHNEELNTVKSKAELEANMKILAIQSEHQSKMQALQEKHNAEVAQYQAKYRELLEQIEQKREMLNQKQDNE